MTQNPGKTLKTRHRCDVYRCSRGSTRLLPRPVDFAEVCEVHWVAFCRDGGIGWRVLTVPVHSAAAKRGAWVLVPAGCHVPWEG